uniref:O-succinylbenzoic acid--CoA ligase n=1 Tax=Cyanothece sp. (strain PCC 7425 / ATCC 29141) TaxID=395961 RepID=B8HPD0_CYAP4
MYTVDETGVMNNYAVEPQMYLAEYPSTEQQRQYVFQAAIALMLVTTTLLTALAVS